MFICYTLESILKKYMKFKYYIYYDLFSEKFMLQYFHNLNGGYLSCFNH